MRDALLHSYIFAFAPALLRWSSKWADLSKTLQWRINLGLLDIFKHKKPRMEGARFSREAVFYLRERLVWRCSGKQSAISTEDIFMSYCWMKRWRWINICSIISQACNEDAWVTARDLTSIFIVGYMKENIISGVTSFTCRDSEDKSVCFHCRISESFFQIEQTLSANVLTRI